MMNIYIGTSGYQYKDWYRDFYPADLPKQRWLEYYASKFNTIEINNSFYRLPDTKTFAKWRDETPDGFVFSIKGSRYITHQLRMREPEGPVGRIFERAAVLGPKLGVVLWQFPESLSQQLERLEAFCAVLARHPVAREVRQAFEFRHPSWFADDTYALLERYNHALVISQSPVWPVVEVATASWSYARFHGPGALYSSGYSDEQLADWASRLRRLTRDDIFGYFNNDAGNFAPWNALKLRELLERA